MFMFLVNLVEVILVRPVGFIFFGKRGARLWLLIPLTVVAAASLALSVRTARAKTLMLPECQKLVYSTWSGEELQVVTRHARPGEHAEVHTVSRDGWGVKKEIVETISEQCSKKADM